MLAAGFLCNSRKVGVACVDVATGRGFRIAREGVIVFPRPVEPAPPAPASPDPTPIQPLVSPGGGCDPNYTGACVPAGRDDVNCPEIGAQVRVVGEDVYDLDREGDGLGCESYA